MLMCAKIPEICLLYICWELKAWEWQSCQPFRKIWIGYENHKRVRKYEKASKTSEITVV